MHTTKLLSKKFARVVAMRTGALTFTVKTRPGGGGGLRPSSQSASRIPNRVPLQSDGTLTAGKMQKMLMYGSDQLYSLYMPQSSDRYYTIRCSLQIWS